MMLWRNSILLLCCGPAASMRASHSFPAREKATNNMMLWHNSILLLRCGPAAAPLRPRAPLTYFPRARRLLII